MLPDGHCPLSFLLSRDVSASAIEVAMECRLCLCSASPETFVSIHGDPHQSNLVQCIWTGCRLRVVKDDKLPDTICLSCVNNLELLDSFRNACFRSDTTSRMELDKCLKVKPEEVLLEDLNWDDELGADLPANISSSSDDGDIHRGKISSTEMMDAVNTPADKFKLRKTLDKKHNCNICSKSFNRKKYLNAHMHIHTVAKPYQCDICSKSFSFQSLLSRHVKSHNRDNLYKCDVCLKSFTRKSSLAVHMSIHTGVKPHKCDICSKSFARKHDLMIHMRCHSGAKPFKCDLCLKSFILKYDLSVHKVIHTGEQLHKCKNVQARNRRRTYATMLLFFEKIERNQSHQPSLWRCPYSE
ncbi:uncharacterized protein LOC143921521 isoform X2 [Arctopsyche grandis]|uniref:uncharacterized protein LOC143921521 isoform X2 n=1 Tax=Arctopsyche grandis TaxID=121162 RepID=UPI00406D9610